MIPAIRLATAEDIPALLEIEQESFSNPNWNANDFLRGECIVANLDGLIVGFLVSRQTFAGNAAALPEREILNVAVARQFRRMKIATALLSHELSRKATHFLEVRESNQAAQALYRKFGFVEIGQRMNYYERPIESAIVMKMN